MKRIGQDVSERLEIAKPPALQKDSRKNSHKHARLTYVRRIELIRALTVDGLSTSEVAALFAVTPATVRKWLGGAT